MPAARLTALLGIGSRDWTAYAACRSADLGLFVTGEEGDDPSKREPSQPPTDALAFCNLCEVRVTCLSAALQHGEVGVWGGTSTVQRRQLLRRIPRLHCPSCGNDQLFEHPSEPISFCTSCGLSWETSKPSMEIPEPREELSA